MIHHWRNLVLSVVTAACAAPTPGCAQVQASEPSHFLWRIGRTDDQPTTLALAPGHADKRFAEVFKSDPLYVVGRSDAGRDWPYAHPGPLDAWAGNRPHTFTILFGAPKGRYEGQCRLQFHLVDTHSIAPPRLRIRINGQGVERDMPRGASDDSIRGLPEKGRPYAFAVEFPAAQLTPGLNRIDITTLSGSWILYDWIGLEAPASLEVVELANATIAEVQPSGLPALLQQEGHLCQPIGLETWRIGDKTTAELWIDGRQTTVLEVPTGIAHRDIWVPAVEREVVVDVAVKSAESTLALQRVTLKPVRKWEIYVLMHSHVDIGYTDVQTNIARKQADNVRRALQLIRQTNDYPPGARFKWNPEVYWAVECFLTSATPDEKMEFERAVREGRIGVDALFGNLLTGLCSDEELIRQLEPATELGRQCGVTVDSAMVSDVPGATWGVVTALAHAGVKYLSEGPNPTDRIGTVRVALEDKPFYWRSPSGEERVLVWSSHGGYAIGHSTNKVTDVVFPLLRDLESIEYPYDLVQLRWSKGDNGQPDERVMDQVREWNTRHAWPKLVIATTSEMFHEFENRYGDRIPTRRGDLTPYWEDGAGSSARETALNRQSAERLVQAETLWAMRDPAGFPAEDFRNAWRSVFLYSEHTWGAHNSVSQPDVQFVKDQWKIKQGFALDGEAQSRRLLAAASGRAAQASEDRVVVEVVNTTSWSRTDLVALDKSLSTPGEEVRDDTGRIVPSQRLSTGELAFLAQGVAPFTARRYTIAAGEAPQAGSAVIRGTTIRNGILSLTVDQKTGAIVEVRTQGGEINLVDTSAGGGLNEYLYLPGADVNSLARAGPVHITVKEPGPLVASLQIESDAPGCERLTREVRLVDGLDRVDIVNVVDKKAIREKEGVHFRFAFNVPGGVVRVNSPWAVVRPDADQIPGSCKNWFTVQRWVDVSNADYGVTWATPDAPLVEVGGITANLLGSQADPRGWREQVGPSQALYSWAMNNHWYTNYKADQEGRTIFRYSIRSHAAYAPAASARFGVECSQPLVVVPGVGSLAAQPRLVVKPEQVLVTAFKPSDDRKAWILRLFCASDEATTATLVWADPAPRVLSRSDASENPGAIVSGPVKIPAWGILTLRAQFSE